VYARGTLASGSAAGTKIELPRTWPRGPTGCPMATRSPLPGMFRAGPEAQGVPRIGDRAPLYHILTPKEHALDPGPRYSRNGGAIATSCVA
jgi:hypothetical protein